jgi:hypothetical protein
VAQLEPVDKEEEKIERERKRKVRGIRLHSRDFEEEGLTSWGAKGTRAVKITVPRILPKICARTTIKSLAGAILPKMASAILIGSTGKQSSKSGNPTRASPR